jgi:erythronate-4-phosphate dehydrogenase
MKIMAVENIPFAQEAFSQFGEVTIIPDKKLSADAVRDTDILLVRSTRPVDRALLANSRVKFVGTATIGVDHVELDYLRDQNITFASAPGSNSNSVSEYITAVLLELAHCFNFDLKKITLGVIGVGQVGSKVVKKAQGLGMTVLQNDPPLARQTNDPKYLPLDKIFAADIITTHVPLTKEGPDRTHHMVNSGFFDCLRPNSIYINSSRGSVVDSPALHAALDSKKLRAAVLDVWEKEPTIETGLLQKVFIGTPHIAGHSYDGKVNGTKMLYDAVCSFLKVKPVWDPTPFLPPPLCPHIKVLTDNGQNSLRDIVRQLYDIFKDDADLRKIAGLPTEQQGPYFSALRKNYPVRREFHYTTVQLDQQAVGLKNTLAGLGFKIGL